MESLPAIDTYARNAYDKANCSYDGLNYYYHIDMVQNVLHKYGHIFKSHEDYKTTCYACKCHDLIEDAKQTYNNILDNSNKDVADVVLAVTDVPAENRLMRHLLTMGKTVKDHRAIILKLCDMHANASYSKSVNSPMYLKYVEEYQYRKPIFKKALNWYHDKLYHPTIASLWNELDIIHNINTTADE